MYDVALRGDAVLTPRLVGKDPGWVGYLIALNQALEFPTWRDADFHSTPRFRSRLNVSKRDPTGRVRRLKRMALR